MLYLLSNQRLKLHDNIVSLNMLSWLWNKVDDPLDDKDDTRIQCCFHPLFFLIPMMTKPLGTGLFQPDSIRVMGDKSTARETMKKAGVPTVPGSDGLLQVCY